MSRKNRRACHRFASFEQIEPRLLFTTNMWKAAVSGDWDTAANWSLNHVPTAGEDVAITVAGNYTVTHSTGSDSCASVVSDAALTLTGGSLAVAGNVQVNNTFTLAGGELDNATIVGGTSGQGVIATNSGGTLGAVTLSTSLMLDDGSQARIDNGISLNGGSIQINSNGGQTLLYVDCIAAVETIGGTGGTIAFGGSQPADAHLRVLNIAGPVTLGTNDTISGGGTIDVTDLGPCITNQGLINSNVNGTTLTIAETLINEGTLEATAGNVNVQADWTNVVSGTITATNASTLTLGATTTGNASGNFGSISETNATLQLGNVFTNSGTITRTGGEVDLLGVLNLNGGTLSLSASTGPWLLDGGGVENGAIAFASGFGLVPTAAGGELTSTTLDSTIVVPDGATLSIAGGITLNNVKIRLTASATQTSLILDNVNAAQTIGGSGQIVFGGSDPSKDQLVSRNIHVATIGSGIVVHGADGTITDTDLEAGFINDGLIKDNIAGGTINIIDSGFVNNGTIEAAPGTINIANSGLDNTHGTLLIGIGGTTEGTNIGQIILPNSATLGGTIETPLLGSFTPTAGQTFTPITYGSATGSFSTGFTDAGGGVAFTPAVGTSGVTLTAVTNATDFATLAAGAMIVTGTANPDTINLTHGSDVSFADVNGTTSVFFSNRITAGESVSGGGGGDVISSAIANDTLSGGAGNDTITGSAGYDLIEGAGGTDSINGGSGGADSLRGGGENDTLTGGGASSVIVGGGSDDSINSSGNADTLVGGPGNDSIFSTGTGVSISGGVGNDTINVNSAANDTIDGNDGTDSLIGSVVSDVVLNIP